MIKDNFNDISVVMISLNEERAVAEVIRKIRKTLPGSEIVLVDSSTDNTAKIAKRLKAKVIKQLPPKGYGKAMIRGLRGAKNHIVITMDCDNTYPIEAAPLMIKGIREGYDLVGTTRMSQGKPDNLSWPNYLINRIFSITASVLFLRKVEDLHTGMRAYRKKMLEAIDWQPEGPALPVELLLKPVALGYKITEIPIAYHPRIGKSTHRNKLKSVFWTFKRIFRCRFKK